MGRLRAARPKVGWQEWIASLAVAASLAVPASTHAQDLEAIARELTDIEGDFENLTRNELHTERVRSKTYVEQRLTDGELFYRLGDYVRASIIFTDIVENHKNHRAYPNALFLLGDSLFRAGDYLGAKDHFQIIIDRANEARFDPYVQRSLGRLIEIAIHTQNFADIESYFRRLDQLASQEMEATTTYLHGKSLYNQAVPTRALRRQGASGFQQPRFAEQDLPQIDAQSLDRALNRFKAVPDGSRYAPQSDYFTGVIYTLRGQYPQAIEAFRRVLRGPVSTPEQQEVVELTYLALGRLYYETDQIRQAIETYQKVPRTSNNFDTALYEVAWAYIRLGDSTRAERALEVLSVAEPHSPHIPDGKLLRGNLLLRNGEFDEANKAFKKVKKQFQPVHQDLKRLVEGHEDPKGYFRKLVRDNMQSFDANDFLPKSAKRWTRNRSRMNRALNTLGDLSQARRLVRETSDLIARLDGVINAPNAVSIFPDLRRHRERTTALRNRLSKLRGRLIEAERQALPSGSGELASVRQKRRRLERQLDNMPTDQEDFTRRDEELTQPYEDLEDRLSELKVTVTGLEARVTAIERYLEQTAKQDKEVEGADDIRKELARQRKALEQYRERIKKLEQEAEVGRLQVGVGNADYREEEDLRQKYDELVERERRLMAESNTSIPSRIRNLFTRANRLEKRIDEHDARVDEVLEERVAHMRKVLNEEKQNLKGYREALASVEGDTEDVVGGITYANFRDIEDRFYGLVLRSDVGKIDTAWARREEHRMRVDMLTRERSRELEALDDEFRNIVDTEDAGEK